MHHMQQLTRRNVLTRSATTFAAVAGVGAVHTVSALAAPPKVEAINKGRIFRTVKWQMIRGNSVLERFEAVKQAGMDGVELLSVGRVNMEEALAASKKTGIPIHGTVHGKTAPDDLAKALIECHQFGGNAVLVTTNNTKQAIHDVSRVVPVAAKLGVHVLFENVWNGYGYDVGPKGDCSAEPFIKLIEAINSPWVGMYFDTGNIVRYGVAHKWAKQLAPYIIKLDMKDYRRKPNKFGKAGFCFIDEGEVDWPRTTEALHEHGFAGWATAERFGGGGVEQLRDTASRIDRVLQVV